METLYQFKGTGNIYTYKQLQMFFLHGRKRKITFNEWFNNSISDGTIINYTDKKNNLSLEEVVEYAFLHDMKFSEVHFQHDNGKEFTVLDAEKGLFSIKGRDGFFTFEDLELDYENEQVFSICS